MKIARVETFQFDPGTAKNLLQVALTDQQADHAVMTMYRKGIIGGQRIADVATPRTQKS